MRLLASIILALASVTAGAQTRIRPIGDIRGDSKGVRYVMSFEARIAQPASHSSAHCVIEASEVQRWVDSATAIVVQDVAAPRAPERIEYDGPELPRSGCAIHVGRTVTAAGSEFQLVVIEQPPMLPTSVAVGVTRQEALAFIAKLRDAARAVTEMNPGLATTHDVQPRPDGTILGQPYFDLQVEKQAAPMPGNPSPHYPDMLRSANVEGEVLAKFIVDSTGRVEPNTFKARLHGHGAGESRFVRPG
jgi:hypothetical protein